MPYKNRTKQREFQRQWLARRRAEYLAGKSCERCGSTDRLELDHIDRRTKVTLRGIFSQTPERRAIELAKCQVLCKSCHVAKSVENGDYRPLL